MGPEGGARTRRTGECHKETRKERTSQLEGSSAWVGAKGLDHWEIIKHPRRAPYLPGEHGSRRLSSEVY